VDVSFPLEIQVDVLGRLVFKKTVVSVPLKVQVHDSVLLELKVVVSIPLILKRIF
jgi:hypothetical protein